jgi:hypothetical protein
MVNSAEDREFKVNLARDRERDRESEKKIKMNKKCSPLVFSTDESEVILKRTLDEIF